MKLLDRFRAQVESLGELKRAWFTTFNLNIPFFETHVLSALLGKDTPVNRADYEQMQLALAEGGIDVRIFSDIRMTAADQLKRTTIPVHGVLPSRISREDFNKTSLFHPKVILLEDHKGTLVLGAGSANLTVSGWARNQEVFTFRTVTNNEQYQQIKGFFEPITETLGLVEAPPLTVRRKFSGNDANWSFVHSFQKRTFLQQLTQNVHVNRLTVWSPYFARDLAQLIRSIRATTDDEMKVSIVPDRIENKYVRTMWTEELASMQGAGILSFHDYPVSRAENIEMTHAKLWLATGVKKGRLAVGSWNFTGPGSASFRGGAGNDGAAPNVEAGILSEVSPTTKIDGSRKVLAEQDFCSAKALQVEELEVPPYDLPFDIQVRFDWKEARYSVDGGLYEQAQGGPYSLRLPGVERPVSLRWRERRIEGAYPLEPIYRDVADNEALLADHRYAVLQDGNVIYRGLVLETAADHRRAQGYDSLQDLLNDLVLDVSPVTTESPKLRKVLRHEDSGEEAITCDVGNVGSSQSYFRLFHAFERFRSRLKTDSRDELEKLVFVYPGSLQELVDKVKEQIASTGDTVFNWFLFQETKSLVDAARSAYEETREKYERKEALINRCKWDRLALKRSLVSLPEDISGNAKYMKQLRDECGYEP